MKRKFKTVISLVIVIALMLSTVGYSISVPADSKGHWAESKILNYFDKGLINGYEDGTFRPDNFVTRAEFVTIINRYFKFTNTADTGFNDIPKDAWYRLQIEKAMGVGYIVGYNDNSFRPNEFITRQETAVIIAKLQKFEIKNDDTFGNDLIEFDDSENIPSWSKGSINVLIRHGLLKGYPDKTVGYQKYLTRAELLVLLDNLTDYIESIPETVLGEIKEITVTNGKIAINFSNEVKNLYESDFIIKATLDGESYELENLKFDSDNNTFTFSDIPKTTKIQILTINVSVGSDKVSGLESDTYEIPRKSTSTGSGSSGEPSNTAPTKPVITRTPSGNITTADPVTITALSTDAEGDAITYIWTGKLDDGSTYPLGKNVITVKAEDEHGLQSEQSAIVFFVIDSTSGNGGVLLTTPNSRIYENGIDGATISAFTFNVPSVSGHGGNDQAWVRGLNVNTQEWEYIPNVTGTTLGYDANWNYVNVDISGNPVSISNGVFLQGTMTPGIYSRIELFYYASHCMYGQSNITYTVEYSFGALGSDVPDEAAPTASNVSISGTGTIGSTLSGSYVFNDDNGDLEGYVDGNYDVISTSKYQWYRSDDASGTNKAPIAGADGLTYVVDASDAGKYLTFEVTPLAVTGVTGTLIGEPAESSLLYSNNNNTDILTFSLIEQTSLPTDIDNDSNTINIEVAYGTDVTYLTPTITLSSGATVSPDSLIAQDFTNPVTYTVTAEDGVTTEIWTVTVTVELEDI